MTQPYHPHPPQHQAPPCSHCGARYWIPWGATWSCGHCHAPFAQPRVAPPIAAEERARQRRTRILRVLLGGVLLAIFGIGLPIAIVKVKQWQIDNGAWQPRHFAKNPAPIAAMLEEELGSNARVVDLHISNVNAGSIRVAEDDNVLEYRFTDEIHRRNRRSSHPPDGCDMKLGEVPWSALPRIVKLANERGSLDDAALDAINLRCQDGEYAWIVHHVKEEDEDGVSGNRVSTFPLKRKR